jgi:hypothetical protein
MMKKIVFAGEIHTFEGQECSLLLVQTKESKSDFFVTLLALKVWFE